jgi:hypothetical protein
MGNKRVWIFLKIQIKTENIPHYVILKNLSQIQCQNAKIQVFDSSLIRINMFASEHLVY